jgi:hypothetical protein
VRVNSVNMVHSVNKVVNPHKDNYHYVGGVPHTCSIRHGRPHINGKETLFKAMRYAFLLRSYVYSKRMRLLTIKT